MNKQDVINLSWVRGDLWYKLRPYQRKLYDSIWNCINGGRGLKFVINCARRFGKTTVLLIVCIEFCIRFPKRVVHFTSSTAKELRLVTEPIMKMLLADCPLSLYPKWNGQDDYWTFNNGSQIHLAGADNKNEDALRGQASHLNVIDEAGKMSNLKYLYMSVLLPMTIDNGGKTLIASTPSLTEAHYYHDLYTEAALDDAMLEFTVWDNSSLDPDTLQAIIKECGGEDSTEWQREYLCKFVTDTSIVIIPGFTDQFIHAYQQDEYWRYYDKYTAMDLGSKRDLTAVLFAVYDYQHATLHVIDEWSMNGPEMTTDVVAAAIKVKETSSFGKDVKIRKRVSDNNNPQMIVDFRKLHNMGWIETDKSKLNAMVNKVRMFVKAGRVHVDPKCKQLIGCLKYGVFQDTTAEDRKFAHHDKYGHFDALAALVYLIRNLDVNTNPVPMLHNVTMQTHVVAPDVDLQGNPTSNAAKIRNMIMPHRR